MTHLSDIQRAFVPGVVFLVEFLVVLLPVSVVADMQGRVGEVDFDLQCRILGKLTKINKLKINNFFPSTFS